MNWIFREFAASHPNTYRIGEKTDKEYGTIEAPHPVKIDRYGAHIVSHPVKGEEEMPLYAKSDVMDILKDKGYSSYRLREEKLLTPRTMQKIRNSGRLTMHELETICDLLHAQPNKVVEWSLW